MTVPPWCALKLESNEASRVLRDFNVLGLNPLASSLQNAHKAWAFKATLLSTSIIAFKTISLFMSSPLSPLNVFIFDSQ